MSPAPGSIRVLQVEDDLDFAEVAAEFLHRHDGRLTVDSVSTATDGIDRLRDADYDCVVSEVDLPGRNGIEFLEAIREEYPQLPVILYTGKGSEEVAAEAFRAGATDYVQKGGGTEQYTILANRIENAVRRRLDSAARLETERRLSELTQRSTDGPLHPDDAATIDRAVEGAVEGDGIFTAEFRMVGTDEEPIWVRGRADLCSENGQDRLVGTVTDVIDPEDREAELHRERSRLTALFQHTIDPVVFTEFVEGEPIVRETNPAFEETFGHEAEGAIGPPIDHLLGREGSEPTPDETEIARRIEAGERVVTEVRRQTVDGVRDFFLQSTPVEPGTSGSSTYAIYSDITESKEREQALRESEERYRRLLETAPTPIVIYSEDGELRYVNGAAVEFLDAADRESLLGTRVGGLTHPDNHPELGRRRQRLVDDREAVPPTEATIVASDGAEKHAILASSPVTYEGEPVIQTVATDVTELKEHEQQLERYETLVEVSGDPMYMLDDSGCFTYVNQALVELTGRSRQTLIGAHVGAVMDEADVERGNDLIRSLLAGDEPQATFEMELVTEDGDRIPTENHISILYEGGEYTGTVGVLRDMTARLDRERQLQRERDRLDEFAGVVSHDLRNPLNVAQGNLDLAMEACDADELEPVDRAHQRMAQLIDDVLTLARAGKSIGETEAVELREAANSCWANVETAAAKLVVETDATVRADGTRLRQLLENVLRNAVDHSSTSPRSSSSHEDAPERGADDVTITIGDIPGGFYVEDDGRGIPVDARESVLDPGYSTADTGSGFGLSIVRDIAEAHGWGVTLTESSQGGARFEFSDVELE